MPRGPHEHRAWKWMSIYVRLRDADEDGYAVCPCCKTPQSYKVKYMDAGHVFPKGSPRFRALEFDHRFIFAQNKMCNKHQMKYPEHKERMEQHARRIHGDEVVDNALLMARTGTRKVMGKIEADLLIEWCQLQIMDLLAVKNIERWW